MHRACRNRQCRTMFDVKLYVPKACVLWEFGRVFWLGRRSVCFLANTVYWANPSTGAIVLPQPRAVVAEALATRSIAQMNTAHLAGVASQETSGKAKQCCKPTLLKW